MYIKVDFINYYSEIISGSSSHAIILLMSSNKSLTSGSSFLNFLNFSPGQYV